MTNPLRRYYKSSPRLRRLSRKTKNLLVETLANMAIRGVGVLSLPTALRLGEFAGAMAFQLLAGSRRLAFGDALTDAERQRIARASFVNVARSFCELARIDEIRVRQKEYFQLEGWEHIERLLVAGRGLLAITGHIGNWELMAAYFAWRGLPIYAVARRIYADRLNELIVDFRRRQGVETIMRESGSSARQNLRVLKSNAILAMLIDQDTHVASISVPFFGHPARTPVAAASLAVRRGLPVVAMFMQRQGEMGYRIVVRPPFAIEQTGDEASDVAALTMQFNAALEEQIRAHPEEWVWWHRRWRRAPMARLDPDFAMSQVGSSAAEPGSAGGATPTDISE